MTGWTLIKRSLRFHWRAHLGVVLGAAVGSAALIGALIVGDSVRESLRERALERLGGIHYAMDSRDRLFVDHLERRIASQILPATNAISSRMRVHYFFGTSVLRAQGTAANADGTARANAVNILGVGQTFVWEGSVFQNLGTEVVLNESLAQQIRARAGDEVLLRVRKPETVSAESPVAMDEHAVALRLRVKAVATERDLGNLSLRANQTPPFNAFVNIAFLQSKLDATGRANLLLGGSAVQSFWSKDDSWLKQTTRKVQPSWKWTRANTENQRNDLPTREALTMLQAQLQRRLTPEDLQLRFVALSNSHGVEVRSDRIFVEAEVAAALVTASNLPATTFPPVRILTYLVNQFRGGTNTTPYSMVSALESPLLPSDLKDDEVIINEWLARELDVLPGTEIAITYFAPDQVAQLIERTNRFRVRGVIPMTHALCDRTLMPDFPGVAKAERAGDWETSFPLVHKIRPQDDEYWQEYRGTPKAFITLAAGQKLWANRFGNVTAVRIGLKPGLDEREAVQSLRDVDTAMRRSLITAMTGVHVESDNVQVDPLPTATLPPSKLGFAFEPVREQALRAASQAQDFGGLFIGFSLFLIIAALILMGLLFAFGLQQRAEEIGTLLALGFPAKRVRKLFLLEGTALAFIGGVIGALGGIVYAKLMLRGLTTIWRGATNTSALTFHVSPITLVIGLCSAVIVAVFTIWLVLRKQARQPASALLAGEWREELHESSSRRRGALARALSAPVIMCASLVVAIVILVLAFVRSDTSNPGQFFGAGSLALICGLSFTSWVLARMLRCRLARHVSAASLSIRGASRRRMRSVATVALLACGVFLVMAIGAFRLDAEQDAWKRSSGTGGFALIGESTLPIVKDLNTREGRDALGLDEKILEGVSFVPFRVREGDDASCLNLNRAQQPKLLGAKLHLLDDRGAFTFANGLQLARRWSQLSMSNAIGMHGDRIPSVSDAASIQWALGKKIGDTLAYQDERGNNFDVRLVGGLANSVLQGSLIIDEAEFTRRFPSISGHRMFLIDCPSNRVQEVSAELTRALQDFGFEVTPAAQRLAAFNAVQNTYLNTFQVLGGLGLLLGSAGLGIVVLRNVLERRGELALLIAVGFRRARVQKLVLAEHATLLCLGLVIGIVSALVAILPSLMSPRAELPVQSLALTLGGVLLFGLVSTWLATRAAVRGNLLEGLRNE
jgi:putative ABC transport system permease protein